MPRLAGNDEGGYAGSFFSIDLTLVLVTDYRSQVLSGEVGGKLREMIRGYLRREGITIKDGYVSRDHVSLLISVPPHVRIGCMINELKRRTSRQILAELRRLGRPFFGEGLWAPGCFCQSTGLVSRAAIDGFLARKGRDDNFIIEDPAESPGAAGAPKGAAVAAETPAAAGGGKDRGGTGPKKEP